MKRPWTADDLLPALAALTLCSVVTTEKGLSIEAAGPASARCPRCQQPSHTRHSRYWRTLRDVAAHGQVVTLRVRVSRWRCRNSQCEVAIFADRLPGVATPRAQHTERLGTVVHLVGHALGGRAGARLLRRLGMVVSADSVVRAVTHGAPSSPADPAIRVVGIDDWAWQKGQQDFGTILVDLERRRVVDVLAVRTADAVAAWLKAHPTIRIISRDRHGPYADGVRRGAPQAREVADRFHLVSNLRDAVQHELGRQRRFLVVPHRTPPRAVQPSLARQPRRQLPSSYVTQQECIAEERPATQLARFRLVKWLQTAGHSAQAIMRETGLGRCYVSKFGYVGCYGGLARLLAPWRQHGSTPRDTRVEDAPVAPVLTRHVSPQVAAALLGQPRTLLSARQAETVDVLKEQCPGFTTMRRLVLSFRTILRVGTVTTLHRWLTRAHATNIDVLQRFVRKLRQDLGAVEGAVRESWSNGPVEGQINRLKMLRRQMDGRAGVELLRARLLPAPLPCVR